MATLRGPFEVTTDSEAPFHDQDGVVLNRNTVYKTCSGPVTGTSEAQMIAVRTPDRQSAGYIALELFTDTTDGKHGSFVMAHNGILTAGEPELSIVIIPGSRTGELTGILGTLEDELA
ncbi:DUF3224 domain-containing protein [Auritidibacter sp. NML120636]|uniref:DUF3224 domain-containing protein n=1 Tax=Auritidibacter sp. NML120636 TaxID=2170743 RepID=UPI000D735FA7|nr:DUF3224 domain-containing protein [Auritidibacter sp. NML120636]PXA80301.1 DUF3224 domain-containing protein [Auritidibacter sp. NML120636]